ncbi:unnamed protein product [Paramecium primaurelia]|uniref:Prefoldin subunit 3 n=2 Tax=Paramecium TaxID=5884 RepID=A0A8S1VT23_9CILI|nr:unnamed protein product [Paramecium primaurelia]CAD8180420.1 unnamed protein product [Paramecium pentaurelia]
MDLVTKQAQNNRKIPEAIFFENIDELISKNSVQRLMESLQEAYNKYKFMEAQLVKQRESMQNKLPEIERALSIVEHLENQKEDEVVDFLITDTIYSKAVLPKENKTVALWLGANVMVEFEFNEAKALLSSNKENASSNLRQFDEDIVFLKDQITTIEVNIARVYNANIRIQQTQQQQQQQQQAK